MFGTVKMQNAFPKLSDTPGGVRWPGPALGEHTDAVLRDVAGLSDETIAGLRAKGGVMSGSYAGGCLCGALRYEARGAPLYMGHCYCADCRKASGSGFIPFMAFAARDLTFSGPTRTFSCVSARGDRRRAQHLSGLRQPGVRRPGGRDRLPHHLRRLAGRPFGVPADDGDLRQGAGRTGR